jgi:hypothetical protein
MKKIVHYEVVSIELGGGLFSEERTENTFTNLINKKIKDGFQPYGELRLSVEQSGSFLGSSGTTRLSQVMVKYEDAV